MRIMLLPQNRWHEFRDILPAFAYRFGEQRLTADGMGTLCSLLSAPPSPASSAVITLAIEHQKLLGFAVAKDAGELACLVVVRAEMRGKGIGTKLMQSLCRHFGTLTCNVACDNYSSMQMCFRAGMAAVSMHEGPTGKMTLRFVRTP
ncbi:GNAT family N-acetyltransferase [Paenibacillus sp. GCM10027626]|uniref:GNAT family N-acetyltransferase n=1 Tax=Paenibacillus sp. GCM10027626 TaxID=3273411 RepID=UPI00363E906F